MPDGSGQSSDQVVGRIRDHRPRREDSRCAGGARRRGDGGLHHGANPDTVSFVTRFDQETVLVGYPKAHLWVEAQGSDDMDPFVLVQKLDAYGTPLQQFTVPDQGAQIQHVNERGASILRYKGSDGRLRVSVRHLD